ncbi:MAG: 4Fe-4S dicluster domain-containing protein, partial [Thermodesulfobacteriota bacterium]
DSPKEAHQWIEERVSELYKNPNITLFTESELVHLDGQFGRFKAKIRKSNGTEIILSPSIIVTAIGFEIDHEREGIFKHKRVINLSEMERLIYETKGPPLKWDGREIQLVTFLLDGVNEDIKIDSIHAIKQGYLIQERFKSQAVILCKDVKVSSDGMERLYRKAREQGVLFFKYEEPPKLSIVNGQIQIDIKEETAIKKEDQWSTSILSDLLVISEPFKPSRSTENLSGLLQIHIGSRGFLMEDNPQLMRIRSNRRGIFVVGACRFPQEISETLIESRAVAQEVITLLSKGKYDYDLSVAEVDPKKCALCYTCPRLCPHSAIRIEKYADRNVYITSGKGESQKWGAARVDPASCYGCGICVAECPAKAITLHHEPDELIYPQMGWME